MATNTVDAEPYEQASLFMELPTELRLQIYALAVEDTVDFIILTTTGLKGPDPVLRGALALLHTSKQVRVESRRELFTQVVAQRAAVKAVASLRKTELVAARELLSGTRDGVSKKTYNAAYLAKIVVSAVDRLHRAVLRWGFTHQEIMAENIS
jgi:hypothetical protein